MNCPHCQTKLIQVLATRKATDGILRYRQCYNGHKFTTKETVIDKKKALANA